MVVYVDGKIYPLEIKKTASPNAKDFKQFGVLRKLTQLEVAGGSVVCMYDNLLPLAEGLVIPVSWL